MWYSEDVLFCRSIFLETILSFVFGIIIHILFLIHYMYKVVRFDGC